MKCCSRSTLGVIIGGINVVFYIGCAAVVIGLISSSNSSFGTNKTVIFHNTLDDIEISGSYPVEDHGTITKQEDIALGTFLLSTILSVCLVMVVISGLLIVGIVKRRHQLMWPFLALSGIAFICSIVRVFSSVIVGLINGMTVEGVLILLIGGILGVCLQALLLWPIYTLCRDIMRKNNQKPGQVMHGVQYSYVTPDAPPMYNYYDPGLPQKS